MNWDFLWKRAAPYDPEKVERAGLQSQDLWTNPAFERAVQKVRQGIHEKWATAPIADADGQLKLRLLLKCLDDIERNIRAEMNSGKVAEKQIKDEEERKKRAAQVHILRR